MRSIPVFFLLLYSLYGHAQISLLDTNATTETKALYSNLKKLAESHVLFGHQDALSYGHGWVRGNNRSDVKSVTGSHPAVIGLDFMGFSGKSSRAIKRNEKILKKKVVDTYDRGGISTICWHFNNPVSNDGFYWNDSTSAASIAMIKPGAPNHEDYKAILNTIGGFAQSIRGQDGTLVPIIFRLFHEFDGDWFWWGKRHTSREDFIDVWRFTVSYLRDSLSVHNFIYAFSPDCKFNTLETFLERYPGNDWVDIIGMDNYADFGREGYYDLNSAIKKLKIVSDYAIQTNKVAALTETGLESITDKNWWTGVLLKVLKENDLKIAYAMVWRNDSKSATHYYAPFPGHPSVPDFLKFYQDPYTLFESDLGDIYK